MNPLSLLHPRINAKRTPLLLPGMSLACLLICSPSLAYKEVKIGHSDTILSSLSLNDNGWAVWTTGHSESRQGYLWNNTLASPMSFTSPLSSVQDVRINNNNWIVYSAVDSTGAGTPNIYLSRGGGAGELISEGVDFGAEPWINNKNQVVWWGSSGGSGINDLFAWEEHTGYQDITITDEEGASVHPIINDHSQILYERSTEVNDGGETNLVLTNLDALKNAADYSDLLNNIQVLTDQSDLNLLAGDLNNVGQAVFTTYDDSAGKFSVNLYDSAGGKTIGLTDSLLGDSGFDYRPLLTDSGDAAWIVSDKHKQWERLYWLHNGLVSLMPLNMPFDINGPVALNRNGELIYASGSRDGGGYDIYRTQLDPPPVPEPAGVAAFLLMSFGGIFYRFRRRL